MLTTADKKLIGVLLFLSLTGVIFTFTWFRSVQQNIAEIYIDGNLVRRVLLRPDFQETYRIGEASHYNVIEIRNGRIRMKEADCPDQDCVKMSWISLAPQQIVCLPRRIVIKIVPAQAQDVDDIVR